MRHPQRPCWVHGCECKCCKSISFGVRQASHKSSWVKEATLDDDQQRRNCQQRARWVKTFLTPWSKETRTQFWFSSTYKRASSRRKTFTASRSWRLLDWIYCPTSPAHGLVFGSIPMRHILYLVTLPGQEEQRSKYPGWLGNLGDYNYIAVI